MKLYESTDKEITRNYAFDWLRVLAVLLLIYFHTARIFDIFDWYIKSDRPNIFLAIFIRFVHQWHMPLFFLLSGAATWFSLNNRTAKQYIVERVKRLVIPLIFGILIIVPPQVYYKFLLRKPNYTESYFQFYPQFFQRENFELGHLWFIFWLFIFSLVALPLFLYIKKHSNYLISNLSKLFSHRLGILLLAIPLMVINVALRAKFSTFVGGWANFCFYFVFFIYGYLMVAVKGFKEAISQIWKIALILGMPLTITYLFLFFTDNIPAKNYSLAYCLYEMLNGINAWLWVIGLIGLGQKYLNFNHKILKYASLAAYPFYILHQTVIVVIGFYVVRWDINIAGQYWLITTSSLVTTVLIFELLQRINIMRFLLGMKIQKSAN